MTNDEKLTEAWAYINERHISILYHEFKPTPAVCTDVRATVNRYRIETLPTIVEFPKLKRAK